MAKVGGTRAYDHAAFVSAASARRAELLGES
jgi:hypothetical protein